MMHIDLRVGEALRIGNVVIQLGEKSGKTAKLFIEADKDVPIKRVSNDKKSKNTDNSRP